MSISHGVPFKVEWLKLTVNRLASMFNYKPFFKACRKEQFYSVSIPCILIPFHKWRTFSWFWPSNMNLNKFTVKWLNKKCITCMYWQPTLKPVFPEITFAFATMIAQSFTNSIMWSDVLDKELQSQNDALNWRQTQFITMLGILNWAEQEWDYANCWCKSSGLVHRAVHFLCKYFAWCALNRAQLIYESIPSVKQTSLFQELK